MTNMMVYFGSNARRSCSERNVGDCQREFVHHVAARDPTLERAGCGLVTPTATTPTPTESVERKSIHSFKRRARYLAPQPFPLCPSTFNACVALKYPQITSPALHSRTSFDYPYPISILNQPTRTCRSQLTRTALSSRRRLLPHFHLPGNHHALYP
jgi:hypothetical protein